MSDQPYKPDLPDTVEILGQSPFFGRLDRAAKADIADDLRWIDLNAGEYLFRQGDPGDSMYIVGSGLLEVQVRTKEGGLMVLDRLDAGAPVGELALLTGQPRTADVVAIVESRLVCLPKPAFDRVATRQPAVAAGFALAIAPRLQRLKLAGILHRLFGDIDPNTLHSVQEKITWRRLADGESLFRQGEIGHSMFIVVNGRLQMVLEADDGEGERVIGEVVAGETVGEFALLTDDVRSATIYATRDTDLVEITRPVFEEFTRDHPLAMSEIARIIVMRQKRAIRVVSNELPATLTFAILPAGKTGPNLEAFSRRLGEALSLFGPTAVFSSDALDAAYGKPGMAQLEPDEPLSLALNSWLQEKENQYRHILFVADREWSNWTRRCLAQSDQLLLIGEAADDPGPNPLETYCHPRSHKELVLLQSDQTAEPSGTLAWLEGRNVATHHHVRWSDAGQWERLARRLTGNAVGMVFSGGAARGMAHIGVIRALFEVGQPVDYIGGASMGAFVGGAWATGLTPEEGMALAARLANPDNMIDRTLPYTAVMASKKVTHVIRTVMGERQIEDLWRPFFCVSTNLSTATPVIHDRGSLWRAVRSSIALPGIFTPILNDKNEVLVDGGVMNNFPLDIMASRAKFGLLIGSNVSPRREEPSPYQLGESLSGWEVLRSRVNPFSKPLRVPTLPGIMLRTVEVNSLYHRREAERFADILIEPNTRGFNFLDFAAYEALERIGYETGRAALAAWQRAGNDTPLN